MIKKKLKTTGGYVTLTLPEKLDEISIGQMMALQEQANLTDIGAISILSGVTFKELKSVNNMGDFQVFEHIVLSLSHQIKHLYDSDAIPDAVIFNDGKKSLKVKVMRNLSIEPVGAFMAARDIIADEIISHKEIHGEDNFAEHFNPSLKACCQVLAQYFYCKVTGKTYNEYAAEEFCSEIKKLRVTEALPIAKHFFTCYPSLWKPKASFFHRLLRFWKNVPGYKHSKNLNISIQ